MKLPQTSPLSVAFRYDGTQVPVGRLALDGGVAVFEFAPAFGARDTLNPLWLASAEPIRAREPRAFRGLHGVFADSLPDAWGEELLRRRCERAGLRFDALTPLDRLAVVGMRGMGTLVYEPAVANDREGGVDLDAIAAEAHDVLEGRDGDALAE